MRPFDMPARGDVVVGLDIGTTSAKAVAFAADATARGSGQVAYELERPRQGYAEQDPRAVAAAALEAAAGAVREAEASGHAVAGISLSSAMHGLLGLDAAGEPLTNIVTWADNRAADQARRLRAGPRGLALHRRTGTPIHAMSPLLKLRWFSEREPDLARRVVTWCGPKEHVLRQLTGELVVDHGIASGSGLFNLGDEAWDAEALAYARVTAEHLAEPVPTTAVLGLSAQAGRRLGLPAGTPVVAGSGDGPLANLGLGAVRRGTVACSIGTSGALRVASDVARVDERGRTFCYVLAPGRWIVGGAINNGGAVLDWAGDVLGEQGDDHRAERLLSRAASVPAGSAGLLFLPHLLGERAPRWADGARGAYVGLTREHGAGHLVRAAVEGVCLQLAVVLGALGDAGIDVRQIRATGGFSRSPLWRRILAGAFGRPIGFAASPEGSGLGAALLGMAALGLIADLDDAADLVTITDIERPDSDDSEVYALLLPLFEAADEALERVSVALSDVQERLPGRNPPGSPDH